jgi:hypothetical protein
LGAFFVAALRAVFERDFFAAIFSIPPFEWGRGANRSP